MRFGVRAGSEPSMAVRATYAALMVPMQIVSGPLLATIPTLYARYGALSLRQVGVAMMLMRLLDVVVDPLIGMASDRTRSRWGRRKPWLLAGALIVLPAVWTLFAIPQDAGIVYFGVCMGLVYLGWTMVEIPHTAWLGELSHDDAGRTTLAGWRSAGMSAGITLFLAISLLPRFRDAAMTPAVMAIARQIVAVLLPAALLVTLLLLPAGSARSKARPTPGAAVRALAESRAMRMLCLSILLGSVASGMFAACYFFYLDNYLGILGSFGYVGLASMAAELFVGLASPHLILRIGKRASLAIARGSSLVALIGMAMVRRGPGAGIAVAVIFAVTSLTQVGGSVAEPVMAAEAAEEDERSTGSSKLGNFMAATALSRKVGIALGGGVALLLLGAFGFDPKIANNAHAIVGFDITLFAVPGLLYLASVVAAMRFPSAEEGQLMSYACIIPEA